VREEESTETSQCSNMIIDGLKMSRLLQVAHHSHLGGTGDITQVPQQVQKYIVLEQEASCRIAGNFHGCNIS